MVKSLICTILALFSVAHSQVVSVVYRQTATEIPYTLPSGGQPTSIPANAAFGTDYGVVNANSTSTRPFSIRNITTETLTYTLAFADPTSRIQLFGGNFSIQLAPGETHNFSTRYDAVADTASTNRLEITSNAANDAPFHLDFAGTTIVPPTILPVDPPTFDGLNITIRVPANAEYAGQMAQLMSSTSLTDWAPYSTFAPFIVSESSGRSFVSRPDANEPALFFRIEVLTEDSE